MHTTRTPTHAPTLFRRAGAILLALIISSAVLAAIGFAGVTHSMTENLTDPPRDVPAGPEAPFPAGRITVAVVVGRTGTVTTDALAPYAVFAGSDRFSAYTVADTRAPHALNGGLHLVPDHTFDEPMPRPDIVVVPAIADPTGAQDAPLRAWVSAQAGRGSRILGVCAGARVLAATGLLDGRHATSFWPDLDSLEQDYPQVDWVRGQRYVQDGAITTTAAVSSGTIGALHLVEQLAGTDEARRVGATLAYPGWSTDATTAIPTHDWSPADLPRALNAAFPWGQPTIGVGLVDGVDETDVAAAMDVYSGMSLAARTVPIGAGPTVTTRHGLTLVVAQADATVPHVDRLIVPGATSADQVDPRITGWAADRALEIELPSRGSAHRFGYDPMLRDLARHADRATALMAAKYTEYPTGQLDLAGPAWPWRATSLFGAALLVALGVGLVPGVIHRRLRQRAGTPRP